MNDIKIAEKKTKKKFGQDNLLYEYFVITKRKNKCSN